MHSSVTSHSVHLAHADGQRVIKLDNISNVLSAQFLPSGHDLLVTDNDTNQQTLILGYYRNEPHAALEDARGNSLEGMQLQAMTALFTKNLRAALPLEDMLREQILPAAATAQRKMDINWGDALPLRQDQLLPENALGIPAHGLKFHVIAMPQNAFLLCDGVVLREGDAFDYADVIASHVELHHDETTADSSVIRLAVAAEGQETLETLNIAVNVNNYASGEHFAAAAHA